MKTAEQKYQEQVRKSVCLFVSVMYVDLPFSHHLHLYVLVSASLTLFSLCDLNIFPVYITATFKEIARQITLDKSSFPFHMTNLAPSNCVACSFVLSGFVSVFWVCLRA